jgi:hypothetical protein
VSRSVGRHVALVVAAVLVSGALQGQAHADLSSGVKDVALAGGYVVPVGCSLMTGAFNGAYLVYGEGAPRRWRTAGYVCGGVSVAVGTYLLVDDSETSGAIVLGTIPVVIGLGAILAAWFVGAPDDVVGDQALVVPWVGEGGAGLSWSGRF